MKAELEAWQQSVLRSFRGEDYRESQPAGTGQTAPGPVQKTPDPLPVKTKPEDFGGQYRALVSYVHETLDNLNRTSRMKN